MLLQSRSVPLRSPGTIIPIVKSKAGKITFHLNYFIIPNNDVEFPMVRLLFFYVNIIIIVFIRRSFKTFFLAEHNIYIAT